MNKIKILFTLIILFTLSFTCNAQNERSEISVSYGLYPVSDLADDFGVAIITLGQMHAETTSRLGAINVSYAYRFSKVFSLGLTYSFSQSKQDLYLRETFIGKITNQYNVIMPTAKFNWLNRSIVTLYSKVGAGVFIGTTKDADKIEGIGSTSATNFAFQVSPIGIELGRQIAFFAEAGLGFNGMVIAGARFKF